MAWGGKQWLRMTKEQDGSGNPTFGVYTTKPSPTEFVDYAWIRMDRDNFFGIIPDPQYYVIRSADAGNRRVQAGTGRYEVKGPMASLLYPQLTQFYLDAIAGFTTSGELWSYTLDHYDGQQVWRYLGCKVAKGTLSFDAQAQAGRIAIDWQGQQVASSPPSLAQPAATDFPNAAPYIHQDANGLITVNGVVRDCASVEVVVTNTLAPTVMGQPYISNLYYAGRDVDFTLKLEYLNPNDINARIAGNVGIAAQLKWIKGPSGSPTNSLLLDLKSSSYISSFTRELPLNNAAMETLQCGALYDRSAVTDLGYTVL